MLLEVLLALLSQSYYGEWDELRVEQPVAWDGVVVRQHLQAPPGPPAGWQPVPSGLLVRLDHPLFKVRQQARGELARLPAACQWDLYRQARQPHSLEVVRSLERECRRRERPCWTGPLAPADSYALSWWRDSTQLNAREQTALVRVQLQQVLVNHRRRLLASPRSHAARLLEEQERLCCAEVFLKAVEQTLVKEELRAGVPVLRVAWRLLTLSERLRRWRRVQQHAEGWRNARPYRRAGPWWPLAYVPLPGLRLRSEP